MNFVSKSLEDYCINHSTVPSDVAEELATYTRAQVPMSVMLTGPMEGSFLGFLVEMIGAKRTIDIGTFTGYSALTVAERLPEDGEVITLDVNPETSAVAQKYWSRSPHGKKIRQILAPATETLKTLKGTFDFVFIDADKPNYRNYVDLALPLLSRNGFIACDNTLYSGMVLEEKPEEENARAIKAFNDYVFSRKDLITTLLPIRDGVLLIRKK